MVSVLSQMFSVLKLSCMKAASVAPDVMSNVKSMMFNKVVS